jgi:hypothetical protein
MKFCTNGPDSHEGRRYACLTCSDVVVTVRVLSIDGESGLAVVAVVETREGGMGEMREEKTETIPIRSTDPKLLLCSADRQVDAKASLPSGIREGSSEKSVVDRNRETVDVLLVEGVAVGDLILVHGGVALARYEEENDDV